MMHFYRWRETNRIRIEQNLQQAFIRVHMWHSISLQYIWLEMATPIDLNNSNKVIYASFAAIACHKISAWPVALVSDL